MTDQQRGGRPLSDDPLVVLTGVDKYFGTLHVLKDIDLTVARGEVVVVIGPSGSGKSTLCRAINRLEPIDSGSITVDGVPLPEEGVLLPQALRLMAPSLVAQLVVLLKDSSLGFIVGYAELLKAIQNNAQYFGNEYLVALFVVGAGIYLFVNVSLSRLALRLQRRRQAGQTPIPPAARVGATAGSSAV